MIGVIGAGAFGTALAVAEAAEGREVRLWGRDAAAQRAAERDRAAPRLPGVALPTGIACVADLAALDAAEVLLLALPAPITPITPSPPCGRRRPAAPPLALCTDNGAMIAWAAAERMAVGEPDDLALPARARWPLDALAAPMLGAGRKGAKA